MRFAIDARALAFPAGHRAGIARWVHNLVSGLRAVDDRNEYLLLCRAGDRPALLDWGPNFRPVELTTLGDYTMASQSNEQLLLPAALDALAPDAYFSPYYVVPLERRCPAVSMFDDMIPWIIMNRMHDRIPPGQFVGDDMAAFQTWKRLSALSAEAVVTISDHTGRDLSAFWKIDPQKVHTIHVGLEDEWHREPDARAIAAFRQRFGLPDRYLLYTGTIEPRKNVEGILAAYGLLRRRFGHDLPLVVAGSRGQHFDRVFFGGVQRDVGALRFDPERGHYFDHVHLMTRFLSRQEQVLLYRSATAFVWPSFYEGFGLPVLEAMACGLPVVTADNSSLPEVGGDAVLYANPRSPDSIAAALDRLLRDSDLAADLSARAAARARTFTNAGGGRALRDLLIAVAAGGGRAAQAAQPDVLPVDLSPTEAEILSARLSAVVGRSGPIVIYGAARFGIDIARALSSRGHDVWGFTDADPSKWGGTLDRWPVSSLADALRRDPSAIVLGSRASAADMRTRLLDLGFDRARIIGVDAAGA